MWRLTTVVCLLLLPAVLCQDSDEDRGEGRISEEDKLKCVDATQIFQKVMANTTCLTNFATAVGSPGGSEYCKTFTDGLLCAARGLVGDMYQQECLEIMKNYIRSNPNEIFDLISNFITIDASLIDTTVACYDSDEDRGEGRISEEDKLKCVDATQIFQKVMANTTCLTNFATAVGSPGGSEYCKTFTDGLLCAARGLVGDMYQQECLEIMKNYIRRNPNEIFDLISNFITIDASLIDTTVACYEKGPTCDRCLNNAVCIEEGDEITCNCDNTPYSGPTCSEMVGVKMKANYMIKYNIGEDFKANFTSFVVGFITKKKQGTLAQLTYGTNGLVSVDMNNYGGIKLSINAEFERNEFNTNYWDVDLSDGEPHRLVIRRENNQFHIQVDENPLINNSVGNLWDTIFTTKPTKFYIGKNETQTGFEGCLIGMQLDGKFPLKMLYNEPIPSFVTVSPENIKLDSTCGRPTGEPDEAWNTQCPDFDDEDDTEFCPQQCPANQDCPNSQVCCGVGNQECSLCIPDMRQCANLTIIGRQILSQNCQEFREGVLSSTNEDEFCSAFWNTMECVSKVVGERYQSVCLKRLALLLRESASSIFRLFSQGQSTQENLQKYARIALQCKVNPLRDAPSRPVSDDVKECSAVNTIKTNGLRCADKLSVSSSSNRACMQLQEFAVCLAKSIFPNEGDDSIKNRKCVSEIIETIQHHAHQLVKNYPALANINVDLCKEKESVCGENLKPLDGVTCPANRCPADHACKNGHCCPMEKEGQCPRTRGSPLCKLKCFKDSDCKTKEKCCNIGCGSRTCVEMVTSEPSKCEVELMDAKKQLEKNGICGNGRAVLKWTNCNGKSYNPVQSTLHKELLHCVYENGTKIPGSDFHGNRDCTKVHPGVCPTAPTTCQADRTITSCTDDSKCKQHGQKCCLVKQTNDVCEQKCVNANAAPEEIMDDCPNRKCCPITLCQGLVCAKDKTAVCRVNSCGGCSVEFYNTTSRIDDCEAGISACQKKRFQAMQRNNERNIGSDNQRLVQFIDSGEREDQRMGRGGEMESDSGDDDDMSDDDDDDDNDDMLDEDNLPEDEGEGHNSEDMDDMISQQGEMQMLCRAFDAYGVCKNGATCKIGAGESMWEICECTKGFSGLFCDQKEELGTLCNRDMARISDMKKVLENSVRTRQQSVLHEILNIVKGLKFLPDITCDSMGKFNTVQMAVMLPKTENSIEFYFCADENTGERIMNTPVTLVSSNKNPDCSNVNYMNPDIFTVPKKCMMPRNGLCNDKEACKFYFNMTSSMCEEGDSRSGFSSLSQCYDSCTVKPVCEDLDDDCSLVFHYGPKPCQSVDEPMTPKCDYPTQFCDVTVVNGQQTGECADFRGLCLLQPDEGYGRYNFGAYYYNATTRRCEKFTYKGHGGNENLFFSLHQCHAECSTNKYKYDVRACPSPKHVASHTSGFHCNQDSGCGMDEVCCSDGEEKRCIKPVKTCSSGEQCSLDGVCESGKCMCRECTDVTLSPVCGTDGVTYRSECHLNQQACRELRPITVYKEGECHVACGDKACKQYELCSQGKCVCAQFCTEQYEPVCGKGMNTGALRTFGNMCKMNVASCNGDEDFMKYSDGECEGGESCTLVCPAVYEPICVYDNSGNTPKLVNYGSKCALMRDIVCGDMKDKLNVLYSGVCQKTCGSNNDTCKLYEECRDEKCQCPLGCPKIYSPVCAYLYGNPSQSVTFDNECLLKSHACKLGTMYVIKAMGYCKKPEQEKECPVTDEGIVWSAQYLCNKDTNAYCDDKTETCCTYGAGTRCLPNDRLKKKSVKKPGICPIFSFYNTDRNQPGVKCGDDSECAGTAKCCLNKLLRHSVCTVPHMRDDSQCGSNMRQVPDIKCDPGSTSVGCPGEAMCKSVMSEDGVTDGVCCLPADKNIPDMSDMIGWNLCSNLKGVGIECDNGGKCVANMTSGQLCQCSAGYHGTFCDTPFPYENCPQFNCVNNPCQTAQCETYPEATCQSSYCGGCLALFTYNGMDVTASCKVTPCLTMKALADKISDVVEKAGFSFQMLINKMKRMIGTDMDDMMSGDMQDDMMSGDMEDEKMIDDLLKKLMTLLARMQIKGFPVNDGITCTATGEFEPVLCVSNEEGEYDCFCVDSMSGVMLPGTRHDSSADRLDCSMMSEQNRKRPNLCFERPEMDSGNNSNSLYFSYNSDTGDCEGSTKSDCDAGSPRNNCFRTYGTCQAVCQAQTPVTSICAAVRCASGICVEVDGEAKCLDANGPAEFEPQCDDDGKFLPKQCSNDVCVCVDPETGNKLSNPSTSELECETAAGDEVRAENEREPPCGRGRSATFCENGEDSCNNCAPRDGNDGQNRNENDRNDENGRNSKLNEDGTCSACETCPANTRRKLCGTTCKQTSCKRFPSATCEIDKCTCEEVFRAGDKVVNCSQAQSNCERDKYNRAMENLSRRLRNGEDNEESFEIICSDDGTYLQLCQGNKCQCLNASSDKPVGEMMPRNRINCDKVQWNTRTRAARANFKVSPRRFEDFKQQVKSGIIRKIKQKSMKYGLIATVVELYRGSLMADVTFNQCDICNSGTIDVLSNTAVFVADINEGEIILDVGGETFTPSAASITQTFTAEELYGPATEPVPTDDDDDDNKTTIIIVVVIVVVVLIVAVIIAVYCYKKANKQNDKDIPFHDIKGQDNPTYK